MNTNTINSLAKKTWGVISKNAPTILSVLAGFGTVTTTVLAVKATPHAMKELEEKKPETTLEKVAVAGKYYLPAAGMGLTTLACIFASNKISLSRVALVSTLYAKSEETMQEYQAKIVERFGEKKEEKVRDDICLDHVNKTFNPSNPIIASPIEGKLRCLDKWSGRYFYSTVEEIRSAVNDLREELQGDWYISLNEFYYALGLEGIEAGEEMGWNADDPIRVKFSSQLCPDGIPCLVVDFETRPKFRFDRL